MKSALLKDRLEYFIKKPTPKSGRNSFAIILRTVKPDGRIHNETIKSKDLDSINGLFKASVQDFVTCERMAKDILRTLSKKEQGYAYPIAEVNQDIFDWFWEEDYADRSLKDESSRKNDFKRAIRAVDNQPLAKATKDQLQKIVNSKFKGNAQRRIVRDLNAILKKLNRGFKLKKASKEHYKVRNLTEDEVFKVLAHIPEKHWPIFYTAFYTGARVGELLALSTEHYHQTFIRLVRQLTEDGTYRAPKNGKERKAVVIPQGKKWVEEWCAIPESEKEKLLHWDHRRLLKRACKKAFPNRAEKHCTIHDLRHSYAIYWRNQGASFSQIAGILGNTEGVCRDHYTGHGLTDEGIDSVLRLVKK